MPKSPLPKLEIEFIILGRDVLGTRIHSDGTTEQTHDGRSWEPLVKLPVEAMAELRAAITGGGFFDLSAEIPSEPDVSHVPTLRWTVLLGDRTHRVTAKKGTESSDAVLHPLAELLWRVVGTELNRIADSGSE